MATTKRIDLFIKPTSSATKQQAIDYAFKRANERDADDTTGELAHYYDITDSRTGAKYMVFGTKAQEELQLSKDLDILDKADFLKGNTDEVTITSSDGATSVELSSSDDYTITANVLNNSFAELRIENKTENGFDIVLYDSRGWEDDEIRLDCSDEAVTVQYTIVYK